MTEVVFPPNQEMLHGPSPEQLAVTDLSNLVTNGFDRLGVNKTEDVLYPVVGDRHSDNALIRPGDRLAAIDVRVLSEPDGPIDPIKQPGSQPGSIPGTRMRRIHLNPTLAVLKGHHGDSLTEYTAPDGAKSYVFRLPEVRKDPQPDTAYRPKYSHVYSWTQGDTKVSHQRAPASINYAGKESAKKYNNDPEKMGITNSDITDIEGIAEVTDKVKEFLGRMPGNPDSPNRIRDDYRGQLKPIAQTALRTIIEVAPGGRAITKKIPWLQ